MITSQVNFEELEKLKKRVLKYPSQYRQEFWGYGKNSYVVHEQRPACGTAGCLAYNVVANNGYVLSFSLGDLEETGSCAKDGAIFNIKETAVKLLNLNEWQADELFSGGMCGWSFRSKTAYHLAKTSKGRAKAAALAIDDFAAKYRAIEAYGVNDLGESLRRYARL